MLIYDQKNNTLCVIQQAGKAILKTEEKDVRLFNTDIPYDLFAKGFIELCKEHYIIVIDKNFKL